MAINPISATATVTGLSVSTDGSMLTLILNGKRHTRIFHTAERPLMAFLLGDARSGTVTGLTVNVLDASVLELLLGGRRFTTGYGTEEREIAAFLIANAA